MFSCKMCRSVEIWPFEGIADHSHTNRLADIFLFFSCSKVMDQSYLAGSQYMLRIPIITSVATVNFSHAYYCKVEGGFTVVQWNAWEKGRARGKRERRKGETPRWHNRRFCVFQAKTGGLVCLEAIRNRKPQLCLI